LHHSVVSLCQIGLQTTMARVLLAAAVVLTGVCASELTKETWDAAVSGKTVFVKFQAPW